MSRDAILQELQDLKLEMRGINPKLSIYAKLAKRRQELILKVAEQINAKKKSTDEEKKHPD